MPQATFSLYILRCGDDTLYTGIATDVAKRIAQHESGPRGAKYLRGRLPLALEYAVEVGDRSAATRLERRVKRLSRTEKERLIGGRVTLGELLDDQGADAASAPSSVSLSGSARGCA